MGFAGICTMDHDNPQYNNIFRYIDQWEFQDPKMEVLYHIRPYFVGYSPKNSPYIGQKSMVGTSNKSVPEMAIDH